MTAGLTRSAALEFAAKGIRVNAMVWLASGKASYVTGVALSIDGGYSAA